MSGTDITKEFESEYARWNGTQYALGACNGTAALAAAMWACGIGAGDEVICQSLTYWASCAAALTLGATVNFADVDPETLCVDPEDIEHRIGPRTKAIIVVHYGAMPADMNAIMNIARKYGVKIIEDNSHAQGSRYKGQICGSIGDIAGASLMSGKAFAIGEAGIMTTSNRELFERCVAFGHYERTGASSRFNPVDAQVHLAPFKGMPMGAVKHRMNQTCAAMGRVQLKYYPERIAEIDKTMNYFADQLDQVPGLRVIRPDKGGSSSKGGWYFPLCHYNAEEINGLTATKFAEAMTAEGIYCYSGANNPLHLHNYFHHADIFNQGKPTAIAFGQRDVRQGPGTLPVTEKAKETVIMLPWFKHFDKATIDKYVEGYRKVADCAKELIKA
jgi:dTDP-4-amino-4,6-dideoxygalactose transaminase